jgi:transcriptional regulator with XRE-family HTH domain
MITCVNSLVKLSQRLKVLRKTHGLTQEEFASMAGFSYKFYQQIESGRKKQIWMKTVERLASAYNLQIWELLAPTLPPKTQLTSVVLESKIHYGQKKKRSSKIVKKRPSPVSDKNKKSKRNRPSKRK